MSNNIDLYKSLQFPRSIAQAAEEYARLTKPFELSPAIDNLFGSVTPPPELLTYQSDRMLETVRKQFEHLEAYNRKLVRPFAEIESKLMAQAESMNALLDFKIPEFPTFASVQLPQAAVTWGIVTAGLLERFNQAMAIDWNAAAVNRMFDAPTAYADFVEKSSIKLAASTDPQLSARLAGSINLAGNQIVSIVDASRAFMPETADDQGEVSESCDLTAQFEQQAELIASTSFTNENDIEGMTLASPTAQLIERAYRVVRLAMQCNRAGRTSGLDYDIFKPSTQLTEACLDMTLISVSSKEELGQLVDCLHFVLYEGAGDDNLRFVQKHGGPLDVDKDCDFVWCLKALRNKWLRHDVDRGKKQSIDKSWSALADQLRWLGLTHMPTSGAEYRTIQASLLAKAESFLQVLLHKMPLKASER